MKCPQCGSQSDVNWTRPRNGMTTRGRQCRANPEHRFTTTEGSGGQPEPAPVLKPVERKPRIKAKRIDHWKNLIQGLK